MFNNRPILIGCMVGTCVMLASSGARAGDVTITTSTPKCRGTGSHKCEVLIKLPGENGYDKICIPIDDDWCDNEDNGAAAKADRIAQYLRSLTDGDGNQWGECYGQQRRRAYAVSHEAGSTDLTITGLEDKTTVWFHVSSSAEGKDQISKVGQGFRQAGDPATGTIYFVPDPNQGATVFEPFDDQGLPAVFTGGVVTDVGELSVQIPADQIGFQTDGATICQAMYNALAPLGPAYGVQLVLNFDHIDVTFDPGFTGLTAAVVFGTTSATPGCSGELTTPGSAAPCPDVDGDGDVDISDLATVLANFGCVAPPACPGDINGDGVVNIADLALVLANFGTTC